MLNIIVCVKQVLDPEAPPSAHYIDDATRKVKVKGAPPVLNPFDENALEAALRIKDNNSGRITVISAGANLALPVFRKVLAAGADELILLQDSMFSDMDGFATASLLAAFIKQAIPYDIIFTGRQAADSNAGVVGSGIAEILGLPVITIARDVQYIEGRLRVEQVVSDGYDVVETHLPVLITVSNELGELRSVSLKDIIDAQKIPVKILNAQEVGVESCIDIRTQLVKLFIPEKLSRCVLITGDSYGEAGENLAVKLRDAQLI